MEGFWALIPTLAVAGFVIFFPRRIDSAEKSKIDEICGRWGLSRVVLRHWATSLHLSERHALLRLQRMRRELGGIGHSKVWERLKDDLEAFVREHDALVLQAERTAIGRQIAAREI